MDTSDLLTAVDIPKPQSAMTKDFVSIKGFNPYGFFDFVGKSYSEILRMEEDISADLEAGTAPDPEFYSAILRRMVLHKARARLREIHSALLARSKMGVVTDADVPKAMGWREEVSFSKIRKFSFPKLWS